MSVALERLREALAERYHIDRELGRGGMAVVFLAEDRKLHRQVAVKVLNPDLAAMVGAERFLREIEIAARLTHPHILPLYDSGEAGGYLFYVMAYVQGESLRSRLEREKQLPVADAIGIARQVAAALAYAHDRDIVHRDIKPENILLQAGEALVTDFGVARAVTEAGAERLTSSGVAIGTPTYMSPEQASGEANLDGRSDTYSLACVLYETLLGEPPFTGATPQTITARKLTQQVPSVRSVRETVPASIDDAIHKALATVPADRYATTQQFADALTVPSPWAAPSARRPRLLLGLSTLAVLALAIAAGLWAWLHRVPPPSPAPTRFLIVPAAGVRLLPEKATPTVALSPDGTRMVYLGWDSAGTHLYQRTMDQLQARPLPGTDESSMPFFSPDSRWVGFVSGGLLKKVPLAGGPPIRVAEAPQPRGAAWSSDGQIIFAPDSRSGLLRVPAAGGEPVALTRPRADRGELGHRWVDVLPGGAAAVFTIWKGAPEEAQIAVVSLETGDIKPLFSGVYARYSPTGHLVSVLADGTLQIVPFDLHLLEPTGPAVPVLEDIVVKLTGAAEIAVSASGTFAYFAGAPTRFALVAIDAQGALRTLLQGPPQPRSPRFSPDGKQVALTLRRSRTDRDVWVYRPEDSSLSRLTFHGGDNAIWTVDGKHLTFNSDGEQGANLFWTRSDLSGSQERLSSAEQSQRPGSWTPDGRVLVFTQSDSATHNDIWVLHFDQGNSSEVFLRTPFNEGEPVLSPDGRWLAYESDESGSYEIYVRSFSKPDRKYLVSSGGGREPRWALNGRRLFYWGSDQLMAAAIATIPNFVVLERRVFFTGKDLGMGSARDYDVHPSGQRFVVARIETGRQPSQLIVVQDWIKELRHRLER